MPFLSRRALQEVPVRQAETERTGSTMTARGNDGEYSVDGDRRTRTGVAAFHAFIKSLRTPLTILSFSFGTQKMILDWIDPSDVGLGLLAVCAALALRTNNRPSWWLVLLSAAVYTGLDYLTGIAGYPWHYWNQL